MKIFVVQDNCPSNNNTDNISLYNNNVPIISVKADSALLKNHKPFFIPDELGAVGYGAHAVIRICRLGKCIPERFAHRYYDALTTGIDFTAVDLLEKLKTERKPWDIATSFDGSAVIGEWISADKVSDMANLCCRLDVNGTEGKEAGLSDLRFSIDQIIAYVSSCFTLKTGDIIFTGTRKSERKVEVGDHFQGYLGSREVLDFYAR